MRQPLPFDTHSYVKRLVAAGMPEAQAEVQADALAEFVLSQLANKQDLQQAKTDLERRIEEVRTELKADFRESELRVIAKLESELRKQMIWFFGMLVVWTGALAGLARLLLPHP
jgi:hypothetical protein